MLRKMRRTSKCQLSKSSPRQPVDFQEWEMMAGADIFIVHATSPCENNRTFLFNVALRFFEGQIALGHWGQI